MISLELLVIIVTLLASVIATILHIKRVLKNKRIENKTDKEKHEDNCDKYEHGF